MTGDSVYATWLAERQVLQALPETTPVPFDVLVVRRVGRDCLISFEGRQYAAPFTLANPAFDVGACSLIASHSDECDAV